MPKLTPFILTISLALPTTGFAIPGIAAQTQAQTSNISTHPSNIALTGKKCAAKRFYSRPRRR